MYTIAKKEVFNKLEFVGGNHYGDCKYKGYFFMPNRKSME